MRWFKSLKITEVKITEVMKSPGPSKKKKKWFLRPNHRSWQRLSLVGLTGKAALPTRTLVAVPEGSWVKTSGPLGSPSLSHLRIPHEVLLFLLGLFIWGPEQTSSGTPFRRRRETPYSSTLSPSLFPCPHHLRVLLGLLFWAHSTASCWPKPMLTHLTPAPLQEGEWKEGSQCFLQCKLLFIPLREVMKG